MANTAHHLAREVKRTNAKQVVGIVAAAIIAVVLLAVLSSCSAIQSLRAAQPQEQYVAADRATYNAIAPVVTLLADTDPANDPDLSGVNGVALLEVLRTWNDRIVAAETPAAGGQQ